MVRLAGSVIVKNCPRPLPELNLSASSAVISIEKSAGGLARLHPNACRE